ncbi:UDP-N-acetylglucosamine 2-epimerase [Nibrella saemangeumensis]|uniref:UDP-N-acetylglucosamine 2-epimerase n=1 Tax=Nibrella saemangeumensis TaxID=1084526 RepID=A0ABP8NDB6_9BACT
MKIGVLTSSRADYSIYYPLLVALAQDSFFDLEVIAFGTHLSQRHGHTVDQIIADGFSVKHRVETIPAGDTPTDISQSMGTTMQAFSAVWPQETYDLVFCLGDRYEMFAAVASALPFNIPLAHIHGGETTLGAIDNAFRHAITVMAAYHFTTTDVYKKRVVELTASPEHVYNVGALSIDNLRQLKLLTKEEFNRKFAIDLGIPTTLITFHPETVSFEKNKEHIAELIDALEQLTGYQLVITMPNADTMGNYVREQLVRFIDRHAQAIGIESFGTIGYLTCMKYCYFMLGNTSSGFVEASFFPKYVVNLGTRQAGRIITPNIINCDINSAKILEAVHSIEKSPALAPISVYGNGNTAQQIVSILKQVRGRLH